MMEEVTTADVALMSADELRLAVQQSRRFIELEKEAGLSAKMNTMLLEQNKILKQQLEDMKSKKGGSEHQNQRLSENQNDDELPALRLQNESLLTRQLVLEAQVSEAARYSDSVNADLSSVQQQLKTLKDYVSKVEVKNSTLQSEIEELRLDYLEIQQRSTNSNAFTSIGGVSLDTLLEEKQNLLEKNTQLESSLQCQQLKISQLESLLNSFKSKIDKHYLKYSKMQAESISTITQVQSALSVNGNSVDHEEEVSNLLHFNAHDELVNTLQAVGTEMANINSLASSNLEFSLRQYFSNKLNTLSQQLSLLSSQAKSESLDTITELESSSAATGTFAMISDPSISHWQETESSFISFSLLCLQRLADLYRFLQRKDQELREVHEDFAELKRTSARPANASRKMSSEAQQLTLQKKVNELENALKILVNQSNMEKESIANEKESQIADLRIQLSICELDLQKKNQQIEVHQTEFQQKEGILEANKLKIGELQHQCDSLRSELNQKSTEHLRISAIIESYREELDQARRELAELKTDLNSKTSELQSSEAQVSNLKSEISKLKSKIGELEQEAKTRTEEVHAKDLEMAEALRSHTNQLDKLKSAHTSSTEALASQITTLKELKDQQIRTLDSQLNEKEMDLAEKISKISKLSQIADESAAELALLKTQINTLNDDIEALKQEKQMRMKLEREVAELRESLNSTSQANQELLKDQRERIAQEDQLRSNIATLQIRSSELDKYISRLPEVNDEAIEAEERAVTKWLEYTLNKEKAATGINNPLSMMSNQLNVGTMSPGTLANLLANSGFASASAKRIVKLGDEFKRPSFCASILNLYKKDTFTEAIIAGYEESEKSATESEILKSLEECLNVARNAGLRLHSVTPQLLYQGNRRAVVDFALEVARHYTCMKISVKTKSELGFLYFGKDEAILQSKSPYRLLLKWVNYWIEDYNDHNPSQTPRPAVTNLGKDLSDGRVLGVVLAGLNPDWKQLAESNNVDVAKKVVNALQQASFLKHVPPFLDSPVPIMRGDETVITIILALLLDWNSGLTSSIAKIAAPTSGSSSAMLTSHATSLLTSHHHRGLATSYANSPLKTPAKVPNSNMKSLQTPIRAKIVDVAPSPAKSEAPVVKPVAEKRGWIPW